MDDIFFNMPEWAKWSFGGIGALIIGGLSKLLYATLSEEPLSDGILPLKNTIENTNTLNVVLTPTAESTEASKPLPPKAEGKPNKKKYLNTDEAKRDVRILFIDDDVRFKIVKILKREGWQSTEIINDISSINNEKLRAADMVFVDIQGVGKKLAFKDEGLGLSKAIIETYPQKYVIIYSAEPGGNMFHEALKRADDKLEKNSDIYQFEKCIQELLIEKKY